MSSNYQASNASRPPVITKVKEGDNTIFYKCENVKLKAVRKSGKAIEWSLVNPQNEEKIFDFPTGAEEMLCFEGNVGSDVIDKMSLIYFKDYDVALPNIKIVRKKS
jgi:hypothetical protein